MKRRPLAIISAAAFAAACTPQIITQKVDPVATGPVQKVCLRQNEAVHMEGFHPALVELIEAQGYPVQSYLTSPPDGCSHDVHYTANWRWDLAMYLEYAEVNVTVDDAPAGKLVYDAREAPGSTKKFGATRSKMAPLIAQLFPSR